MDVTVVGFAPWPNFTPEEIDAASRVLASNQVNYWTGEICHQFETAFADWVGTKHAVALANGTAALEVALRALGIGPGDEVITTPRTFIATASAIVLCGASPVFADVDPDSQNITADTIAKVVTERTRAIVCVHLAGMPCDLDPILDLARSRNLRVIEDCAQAHGARYKGRSVGSIGDVGAWSFCQDKIMTTGGEGGMVTTNDRATWAAMWSLKDHGKDWSAVYEQEHPPGPRLIHHRFGTNWRMLELQAAIGLVQLRRMPEWTKRRAALASRLTDVCRRHSVVRVPAVADDLQHAYYRFYAFVVPSELRGDWCRDRIVDAINAEGIPCFQGSTPEIYLEKAFEGTPWRPEGGLPTARILGQTSLAFLVHPTITDEQMTHACAVVDQVLTQGTR